jgi:chromosomal replication initiation ATPase DnaA
MTNLSPTFQIYKNKHVPLLYKEFTQQQRKINAAKAAVKMITEIAFDTYDTPSRKREYTFARQCFTALVKRNTSLSLREIGELYKIQYDHSTIIRHCEIIQDIEHLGKRDPKFKEWEQIKENFNLLIKW